MAGVGFFDLRPVLDFSWSPQSIPLSYTVGGNTYPYTTQADAVVRGSDSRYAASTTPINTLLTFVASLQVPVGLTILEYRWDFGDGSIGYGSTVSHTYTAANPQTSATLNVLANNGHRGSLAKVLNLRPADRVSIRGLHVTVPNA